MSRSGGSGGGARLPGMRESLAVLVLICLAPSAFEQMLAVLNPIAPWLFGLVIAAVLAKYLFYKFRRW